MKRVLLGAVLLAAPGPARAKDDAPKGDLIKTVRVLFQNVYGRKEADCGKRYAALAASVAQADPPYDVVALAEHWKVKYDRWFSCPDADALTAALKKAGLTETALHKPAAAEFGEVSGGVSVFSRLPILEAMDFKVARGRPIPLSGYLLTRLQAAQGAAFDLWTVHLEASSDGCDDDCRWEQATDLGLDVELFSGAPDKGKLGNPVLLVGDLNTGGPLSPSDKAPFPGNAGYANVMDALGSPRDLWLELSSGGSDAGYTYDCQLNAIQTCSGRERIDYALLPEKKGFLDPSSGFVLVPVKASVVRFKTDAGGYVSDHFGLDATLELRRRPAPASSRAKDAASLLPAALEGARAAAARFDGR